MSEVRFLITKFLPIRFIPSFSPDADQREKKENDNAGDCVAAGEPTRRCFCGRRSLPVGGCGIYGGVRERPKADEEDEDGDGDQDN